MFPPWRRKKISGRGDDYIFVYLGVDLKNQPIIKKSGGKNNLLIFFFYLPWLAKMNPLFVTGFIFVSTTTVPHNYIRQFSPSLALQLMSNSTSLVVWGQILQPNRWARNYSTLTTERPSVDNFQLDPAPRGAVTGFVDGEGCFTVSITEYKKYKLGLKVEHKFIICLHVKDQAILEVIKKSLGVGKIYKSGPQSIQYVVTSIKELERVINHFDQYPLITKKRGDFDLLKKVFILIKNKEHLTAPPRGAGFTQNCSFESFNEPRFIRQAESSLSWRCTRGETCSFKSDNYRCELISRIHICWGFVHGKDNRKSNEFCWLSVPISFWDSTASAWSYFIGKLYFFLQCG